MKLKDARHLSTEAQEALRYRFVNAVKNGMSKSEAARVFKVLRTAVHHWTKAATEGAKALKARKRGRPQCSRLLPDQAATAVRLMDLHCPDALGVPFYLWTREAVQQFLAQRFGLSVSVWTVGRDLKKRGFTPQKPLHRAYELDPLAVKQWLENEYPQICRQAHRENAEIYWGDEMGVRSDYQAGRSYGRIGQTPIVPSTGKRFGCSMISTITNRGKLCFKLFTQRFDSAVMLDFLRRTFEFRFNLVPFHRGLSPLPASPLIQPNQRLLILENGASYHCSQVIRDFLAEVNQGREIDHWQIHCVRFAPN